MRSGERERRTEWKKERKTGRGSKNKTKDIFFLKERSKLAPLACLPAITLFEFYPVLLPGGILASTTRVDKEMSA